MSQKVYIGVVKLVSAAKGISLVVIDGLYPDGIEVHRAVADPQLLAAHDVVAFKVVAAATGPPRAVAPLWKLLGWGGTDPPPPGSCIGRVRAPLADGTIWVEQEVKQAPQVQIHERVLDFCGLGTGDTIAFSVQQDESRKLFMPAPCWRCCSPRAPVVPAAMAKAEMVKSPLQTTEQIVAKPAAKPSAAEALPVATPQAAQQKVAAPLPAKPQVAQPKEVYVGFVKSADEIAGMSMAACPSFSVENDVCVPSSVADPEILCERDIVAFAVDMDSNGKAAAAAPFWKLMGSTGQEHLPAFAKFSGKIGRAVSKTLALVECQEVVATMGSVAYIAEGTMDACMLTFGDSIAFTAKKAGAGQLLVESPVWRCCTAPPPLAAEEAAASKRPADRDRAADDAKRPRGPGGV